MTEKVGDSSITIADTEIERRSRSQVTRAEAVDAAANLARAKQPEAARLHPQPDEEQAQTTLVPEANMGAPRKYLPRSFTLGRWLIYVSFAQNPPTATVLARPQKNPLTTIPYPPRSLLQDPCRRMT